MGGIVLLLLGLGVSEKIQHKRRLNRIRYRIHVNGTRGKSSVTRLIAAGLRASGMRTVAKTTGTLPRIIMPDGTEHPVHRHSRPNVIEQKSIVREACRLRAEALVLECMAVQPRL
ncbi:MAG: Mur ligase family protein, partial [Pirellulales bacterium]